MRILETLIVTFSMFSAVPMPQIKWNERNMRWSMCAFPLIGLLIGLAVWGLRMLGDYLQLPKLLLGAGCSLLPLMLTGGIHMDGFADTWDALASHAEPLRKQEILKDPHIGAFGALHMGMYLIASASLWASLPVLRPLPLFLLFTLSRTLSGLSITRFPLAKNTGLAYAFASSADRKAAGRVLIALALILTGGLCFCGDAGFGMAAAGWGVFAFYKRMARKEFGGLSGDLAGWFLQTAELWMLAAMCLLSAGEAPVL
ncbi:MAG: adenosylcobinamide-GDP ribazoletransferase [Lachnospiraceae bacterium]|nr:adenosylcobinamide-GDP ribazoletransferase [Lachnospiraceae bacterium]